MPSLFLDFMTEFSSNQIVALAIVGMGVGFLVLVSLAGIIVPAWANVAKLRMEWGLKQSMLKRGMSAEEVIRVISASTRPDDTVNSPCASEVVVERDEAWCPALVLRRQSDRYFVHYIGHEMSENEWVTGDRVRFPESSWKAWGSPWDGNVNWGAGAVFGGKDWCSHRSKPAPVDQEI